MARSQSPSLEVAAFSAIRRMRLMRDIKEIVEVPYPYIGYHVRDSDMTKGCLVLSPPGQPAYHITVEMSDEHPLRPPAMHLDSGAEHPGLYSADGRGSEILASVLDTCLDEDYSPIYTLKAIAIQMLSFFHSDHLDVMCWRHGAHNGHHSTVERVNLAEYRRQHDTKWHWRSSRRDFRCSCGFNTKPLARFGEPAPYVPGVSYGLGVPDVPGAAHAFSSKALVPPQSNSKSVKRRRYRAKAKNKAKAATVAPVDQTASTLVPAVKTAKGETAKKEEKAVKVHIGRLSNEMLYAVLGHLDEVDTISSFAKAWPFIDRLIQPRDYAYLRLRELKCALFHQNSLTAHIGIVVFVTRKGQIASDFDFMSHTTFRQVGYAQQSTKLAFTWLPLPISWKHWRQVRGDVSPALDELVDERRVVLKKRFLHRHNADVLYQFMSDFVTRLNADIEQPSPDHFSQTWTWACSGGHASEKALEAILHIFHLLVCMACEDRSIVVRANKLVENFVAGERSTEACPKLAHLLIALLISDVPITDRLRTAVIEEAITRNVVYMLDKKGGGMPELSFLECDTVSEYRLQNTFRASIVSYRLLMFCELFRRTVRPPSAPAGPPKPLEQVRDELFAGHGLPSSGTAAYLASEVRRQQRQVHGFPEFCREMGLASIPGNARLTALLRHTVIVSMEHRARSRWVLAPVDEMLARLCREPTVGIADANLRSIAIDYISRGFPHHWDLTPWTPQSLPSFFRPKEDTSRRFGELSSTSGRSAFFSDGDQTDGATMPDSEVRPQRCDADASPGPGDDDQIEGSRRDERGGQDLLASNEEKEGSQQSEATSSGSRLHLSHEAGPGSNSDTPLDEGNYEDNYEDSYEDNYEDDDDYDDEDSDNDEDSYEDEDNDEDDEDESVGQPKAPFPPQVGAFLGLSLVVAVYIKLIGVVLGHQQLEQPQQ
ncbi:hypothetical protein Micbo1qcDRAFT_196012 [Microdochium bolleyi]|uniref:Uncharacterized protein n=1 Tax=Microdochium bolleyi TaxID=196109 RepID=A0A136IZQ9_9PEZI|nr:hypothetical protein Micbo1qcDRAFT_196012 [Microdochium bolleyi]